MFSLLSYFQPNGFVYLCLDFLFEFGTEWIVDVAPLGFWIVEQGSVVRVEVYALLDAEGQVRGGDEVSTKDDGDVLVLVLFVDGAPGGVGPVAAGEEDGARVAPGVDEEVQLVGRLEVRVARHPRLDEVEVGQVQGLQVLDDVGELGDRVVHLHALETRPRAEADADPVGPHGVDDGAGDLQTEAGSVLDAPAVLVGAGVADVLQELVHQVPVGGVDLDPIEPGLVDGVAGGRGVVPNPPFDLFRGELMGNGVFRIQGVGGRRNDGDPFGFGALRVRAPPQSPELQVYVRASGVDGLGDPLPSLDLGRIPDPGDVWVTTGPSGDEGGLADQKGPRDRSALGVVSLDERQRNVVVVGSKPSQRCHDESILERHGPDLEWLKESGRWRGGEGTHCFG